MTNISFLARTTWGQPRYLLVAMACLFALALIPMGVWRAMQPTDFAPEQLLSGDYAEVKDLAWVRDHFRSDAEVVVSWNGCTLGDSEPLALLAKKLESHHENGARLFDSATTGPQALRALMASHPGLSYADAIGRIEGSLIGPQQSDLMGRSLGNNGRATCLIVKLSPAAMADMHTRRAALDAIPVIAQDECGIEGAMMHVMGAPVESVAVARETPRKAISLFSMLGVCSAAMCYWRLRSKRLTAIVVGVAAASAALTMALPSYTALIQVLWTGHTTITSTGLPAHLWSLPALVYILTLASGLHLVHSYVAARRAASRGNESAAAEVAASRDLRPMIVGALAMVAAVATLALCDVSMLRQFGAYAAPGALLGAALLIGVATVVLHRYPLDSARLNAIESGGRLSRVSRLPLDHSSPMLGISLFSVIVMGIGLTQVGARLTTSDFAAGSATVARDVAWFERRFGNVVPLEIVIAMPAERLRDADDLAEQDGQQYRLTKDEQLALVREVSRRLRACPTFGGALSAETFAPWGRGDGENEVSRDNVMASAYLQLEHNGGGERLTGRELWRLSTRVARRGENGKSIDFGQVVADARNAIDPALWAYHQRDQIVQELHEHGKQLNGARVCVLFRAPAHAKMPPSAAQERVLGQLLSKSGTAPAGVSYFNLASYDRPGRGDAAGDDSYRRTALASLRQKDVVVLASAASDPTAQKIADTGILLADVTGLPATMDSSSLLLADGGGPRPIRAAYAGPAAVVERAEQLLLGSLAQTFWIALGLVGVALTLASMSVPAGLLLLLAGATPLFAIVGVSGWLGWSLDLSVATALSLTVGLSFAAVLHVVGLYQRGRLASLDRAAATARAMQASRPALLNIAIVVGLSVTPLAFSSMTPLRDLAIIAAVSAVASAATCLSVLPAMLASPLGWFLAPAEIRRLDPLWPRVQALLAKRRQSATPAEDDAELIPLPQAPNPPHFVDAPATAPSPARRAVLALGADERREIAEGPHAALQAKLQGLRRPRTGESPTS